MIKHPVLHAAAAVLLAALLPAQAGSVRLDQLDLTAAPGRTAFRKNQSTGGQPIRLGGVTFEHGLSVHGDRECPVMFDGRAQSFAKVGSDDHAEAFYRLPRLNSSSMATIASSGAAAYANSAKNLANATSTCQA